jgi:hypothetical protein
VLLQAVGSRPVTASTEGVLPQQPPAPQQRLHSSPGKGGRHMAEVSTQEAAAAAGGSRSSGSTIMQPVQQQQAMVQASKLLHTPQRTAAAGSSLQRKRWVVPQQESMDTASSSSSSIITAGIASSREACVTPPRQTLPSTTASGAAVAGLQSPRLSALGSARRIVPAAAGAVGRAQLLSPRRAGEGWAGAGQPDTSLPTGFWDLSLAV